MLKGGCFCGKLRYEVSGTPFDSTICHCADCRRAIAAPFVAWFSIKSSEFRFVRGVPASLVSSESVLRDFCPTVEHNSPIDTKISSARSTFRRVVSTRRKRFLRPITRGYRKSFSGFISLTPCRNTTEALSLATPDLAIKTGRPRNAYPHEGSVVGPCMCCDWCRFSRP